MGPLGGPRTKALVPYGGTSRLVDFSLANARRSGLPGVLLLDRDEQRSLMDDLHLVWNTRSGFRVDFGPYDEAYRHAGTYRLPWTLPERTWPQATGTADALIAKAPWVFAGHPSDVLVLQADHVYLFDYAEMIARHRRERAALTIAYQRIDPNPAHPSVRVSFDAQGDLAQFVGASGDPDGDLVFAGFCVFRAAALRRYLDAMPGAGTSRDLGRDVILAMLAGGERIRGYAVSGYWADVTNAEAYHRSHRGLLLDAPTMPVAWLPRTVRPIVGRRLVTDAAGIRRSIIPTDLINLGTIAHSVVFPGVEIGAGAMVEDSILLPGAVVSAGAHVASSIVLEDGTVTPSGVPGLVTGSIAAAG
jgi:glucose-1-phosphate adenylyltransferase